jgi:hypothetical protein
MEHHSIFSIQAVVIASMVGNVLGKSDLLTTLVHACITIAQCLDLHHIPDDTGRAASTRAEWDERAERETGRRIWWKLVQLDYNAVPYTSTYSKSLYIERDN